MKITVTLLLIVFSYTVNGKTTGITLPTLYPHFGSSAPTNNMGGTPVRLIGNARAIYDMNGYIPFDSSMYSYSDGRGGVLDLDYLDKFANFDTKIYYEYDKVNGSYKNILRSTQIFNLIDKIESITEETWSYINNHYQWHNNIRLEYLYGNDLMQLLETNYNLWNGATNSWWNNVNNRLEYDAQGNVAEIISVLTITKLTYDNAGNIIERMESERSATAPWQHTDKYTFTYNALLELTSYKLERYNNGVWEYFEKRDYTYLNGNLTNTKDYSWLNGSWQLDHQNNLSYDVNENKISDEFQKWNAATNSFVNLRKEFWTYNPQNQPTSYYSLTWNIASQNWLPVKGDFYNRYYYEFYIPTGIPNDPFATAFKMYPQPANNFVNIQLNNTTENNCAGYIYDMQGKIIKTFDLINAKQTVPVDEIPAGTYMICVALKGKKIAQPFLIAR